MIKYEILWSNCIAFGVDNTSVNIGRHKSLIVEARKKSECVVLMGCPCHIAHNTARKSTKAFCNHLLEHFDVEELLVDIYFHFNHSSKRKNLLAEFNSFCDQNYCKIIFILFASLDCLTVLKNFKVIPFFKKLFPISDPWNERWWTEINMVEQID